MSSARRLSRNTDAKNPKIVTRFRPKPQSFAQPPPAPGFPRTRGCGTEGGKSSAVPSPLGDATVAGGNSAGGRENAAVHARAHRSRFERRSLGAGAVRAVLLGARRPAVCPSHVRERSSHGGLTYAKASRERPDFGTHGCHVVAVSAIQLGRTG
jgi:hypothetical protein